MSRNRKLIIALGVLVIAVLLYLLWPGNSAPPPADQSGRHVLETRDEDQPSLSATQDNAAGDLSVSDPGASDFRNGDPQQQAAVRRQGFTVRGMILTERGERVSGARIEACELGLDNSCGDAVTAFSDASGFYELQLDLDTDKQKLVSVQKPGFLTTEGILQMRAPGGIEQDYVLQSASASLKGRVIGPDRGPVAGAQISITCLSEGKLRWSDTPVGSSTIRAWSLTTTANSSGEFVLPGLPAGNGMVQARAARYLQNSVHRISLHPGENSIDIRLDAANLISFAVKNRRGQPLDNVSARGLVPDSSFSGTSDREGVVELNVPIGVDRIECELTAPNHQSKVVKISPAAPPAEVVLDDGWALRGTVVSSSGQPLLGARVVVVRFSVSGSNLNTHSEGQVTTDDNGRFEIGVSSDHFLKVSARRQGYLETRVWIDNLDDEQETRIVMRPPDGALHGVVLEPSGQPATQFQIQLSQAQGEIPENADPLTRARASMVFSTAARFEQPGGRFEFPELPAGNLVVRVSQLQGGELLSKTQTVSIRRGVNTEVVIRLDGTN